jgi:membrane-associated phospholipid phosphatase
MIRFPVSSVAILAAVAFSAVNCMAQADSSLTGTIGSDASMVWHDAGTVITMPLHFTASQWMTTGAVCGGTILLFTVDQDARAFSQRNISTIGDNLADIGTQYGRAGYGIALAGGLYAGGLLFHASEVRLTGVMLLESIGFAGVTTTVLKSAFGRSRPYMEEGRFKFRGFQTADDYLSFPSGHATVAFSVSSILAARINRPMATVGLYTIAAVTSFSRVYNDEHWLSDVFLGAAIGTASGLTVASLHNDEAGGGTSFRLVPTIEGLRAEVRF